MTLGERTLGPLAPGNPEPCCKRTDNQRWSWVLALPPGTPWGSASVGGPRCLAGGAQACGSLPGSQGVGFFRVCLRKFSRELGKGVIIAWQVLGCTLLMFSTFPVFSWGRRPCSRRPFYSRLGRAINVAPRSPRVFLLVAGICSGIKSPLLSSGRKTLKTLVIK